MKKMIFAAILLLGGTGIAFAGSPVASSSASAGSSSGAIAGAQGSGTSSLNLNQTYNSPGTIHYGGGYTVNNVPALATMLISPTASCMGSLGGTAAVAGFGIGLGGSYRDHVCEILEEARMAWNMGQHQTAAVMLCRFKDYRKASALSGNACPPIYGPDGVPVPKPVAVVKPVQAPRQVAVAQRRKPAWCSNPVTAADKHDENYIYYCQ